MSCHNNFEPAITRIVRLPALLPLLLAALLASPAALALDSGDIVIVSVKGEVHFTVNGDARALRAGGVLEPPASLRTGADGAVELKQGATTVSVGPETQLEFPALEKRGGPIDRVVQPSGNAFYNIGKREGRKLRIETPYLVGVVKGTQFNVAARNDATTISLFEGLLEVRATDDSDVVELNAGQIASRARGAPSIDVMKMDKAPAGRGNRRSPPPDIGGRSHLVEIDTGPSSFLPIVGVDSDTSAGVSTNVPADDVAAPGRDEVPESTPVDAPPVLVDTGTTVNVPPALDMSTGGGIEAGPVSIVADVGTTTTIDLVDAGAGTVNVGLEVGNVDPGLEVDLGLDDDDGNNGHGNDDDHSDSSNPGHGRRNETPVIDVGGLLDGLPRRPGKR